MVSQPGEITLDNSLGAFCIENHVSLRGRPQGPLKGLSFAVKDLFHVQGVRTGFGNPVWLRTHPPAEHTAWVVRRLLDAGATLIGKTITDEMAYSLTGENAHYGTPVNPVDPQRVPGGSSSGSAVAVAGGVVDFSVGTDCGGSVRIPASYCGIFGMRPTHGRIPLEGAIPFASSFDVVGWFARDADVMDRVGRVLLDDEREPERPQRMLLLADGFSRVDATRRRPVLDAARRLARRFGDFDEATVSPEGLDHWRETFQVLQAAQIWSNHGAWVSEAKPEFGPGIRERFEWASTVREEDVRLHKKKRIAIQQRVEELLRGRNILCLPTAPRAAPLRNTPVDTMEIIYRNQAMCLLSIAGLCGLPQISIPVADTGGPPPIGLSLIGAKGTDLALLALARELSAGA